MVDLYDLLTEIESAGGSLRLSGGSFKGRGLSPGLVEVVQLNRDLVLAYLQACARALDEATIADCPDYPDPVRAGAFWRFEEARDHAGLLERKKIRLPVRAAE